MLIKSHLAVDVLPEYYLNKLLILDLNGDFYCDS